MPTGNIYMSSGTTVNRPSFDLHQHEYNVVSTSIYGTTKWILNPENQFSKPLDIKSGDQVIIPANTPHACVDAPEKRCSLTICLG
jgi:quercetin dioxygenase-like cupin family protein